MVTKAHAAAGEARSLIGLLSSRLRWLAGATAIMAVTAGLWTVSSASASLFVGTGTHPWVVVLCNFSDEAAQPNTQAYYQQMFSDAGAGQLGELDYWHDVSFGQVSISGTTVTNWVTARDPNNVSNSLNRAQWSALGRFDKIRACADGADQTSTINWSNYWGVIAIFPEARSTLAAPISATDTSVTLTTTTNFPDGSAPFPMNIDNETVNVTGVTGNTLTIQRAQGGTTAAAHTVGAAAGVPGDLGDWGPGQLSVTLGSNTHTLATVVLPHEIDDEGASHEMGHGFGYNHSRPLSNSTNDYNDCYDLMSAYSCDAAFSGAGTDFGGSGLYNTVLGEAEGSKGPGLDAINLDKEGWIPGSRQYAFDNSTSNQATLTLHALSDPNALSAPSGESLEARVPASVTIQDQAPNGAGPSNPPQCSGTGYGCTTSLYYTAEYREKSGWDRGLPASGVQLHLLGQDSIGYWVDQTPNGHGGLLYAGDEYVDSASKAYFAVNSVSSAGHSAQVTLGSRKIDATLSNLGPASDDYNDAVTLAADLTVSGSGAPVPSEPVVLSAGSQSCVGTTDANGHASCQITSNQDPGSYTLSASFAGDSAYASSSATTSFTINQEETQLSYTGATTSHYHDAFTASATLVDPDGGAPISNKQISFTLGVGDTCNAVTDGSGTASCSITPTQTGMKNIVASFGPDTDYVTSGDTKSFSITPEETTVTYTGPTVILAGPFGATLTATMVQDGANDTDGDGVSAAPNPSETVTLSLGSQSCTGTTGAAGEVSCTIPSVAVPLGPETILASFAGDGYYQPSSDFKTAVVFAFPSRGAFTLGNATAAAAGPTTTVTWWGDTWSTLNVLSGGSAPLASKGFAASMPLPTSTPPAACGGNWSTSPGNSPPPVSGVPSYMGTLVTSNVIKSGSAVSGNTIHIVVVRTNPGYAPDPSHHGTGTIVATYC
ncbi:MAG TPA: Ig-like domain-containing protein [Solirubrobacteraceae bacterium]|nr:Ig-like domain-containing protein [Solirubrobacteraceae bacterium]